MSSSRRPSTNRIAVMERKYTAAGQNRGRAASEMEKIIRMFFRQTPAGLSFRIRLQRRKASVESPWKSRGCITKRAQPGGRFKLPPDHAVELNSWPICTSNELAAMVKKGNKENEAPAQKLQKRPGKAFTNFGRRLWKRSPCRNGFL